VIRGPATLRYGSQSIGGVVSSTNNRIPDALPCGPFSPLARHRASIRRRRQAWISAVAPTSRDGGAVSSVDNGHEGGVLFDTGRRATSPSTAIYSAARPRITGCRAIPIWSLPIRRAAVRDPARRLQRPAAELRDAINEFSVGSSYLFFGGFAGIAYTQHNNLYSIPGADGEGHGTRIAARQDKVTGKGEYRPSASGIDAIRYWWGYTDYKHNEIGCRRRHRPRDRRHPPDVHQQGSGGRAEVQLMPLICGSPS
jgi:iron complex outermembrane receptor protein